MEKMAHLFLRASSKMGRLRPQFVILGLILFFASFLRLYKIGSYMNFLGYKIGKEFFGEGAGIIASLLYAISPVVIIYSRSSWNPNIVPFFSIATLYLMFKGIQKKKYLLLMASGICFGIL